ncbi:hypothetical protein [Bacillus horti]|uniref:DUF3784 domain-containing protein n=1 Tax=Caldalkalibacillus horti TaxID=77523 RepID=A0ABT9W2E2_9BACI|nr:hypothetical protein [Bacillus horti]MDQ0167418.1 hypothetical protein [Bacillus horti]
MGSFILAIIFFTPLYCLILWAYFSPEESMLFGQRWVYKEEPEFSPKAIRHTKFTSLMALIGIPIFVVDILLRSNLLKIGLAILLFVYLIGIFRIITDDKE